MRPDRARVDGDPSFGWIVVAGLGVTETVSYGVLYYAFAVLLLPMHQQTGWSASAITGAYSLALLVSGLAAPFVGKAIDRGHARALMTSGSLLGAFLLVLWSRAATLFSLYFVFAGLGVAMALVLYEPAFAVVTKWFRWRRRAALTALTLIAAWASFIFSPLTEHLVATGGWRHSLVVLAGILAATTLPLHAFVLRAPPTLALSEAERHDSRDVPRSRGFWLIVASFTLGSFATVAIAIHVVRLLVIDGMSPSFVAFAAGLLGLSQIPGRLLFALIERHLGPAATAGLVFALSSAALILLTVTQTVVAAIAFVICFGMSNGMATLLRATLIGDLYGRSSYGVIAGRVNLFTLGARAAAPVGAAAVAASTPSGDTTLLALLAALSIGAAASVFVGTRHEQRRIHARQRAVVIDPLAQPVAPS